MSHIKAPFTEEQVKKLEEWQANDRLHPFTCCSPEDIKECQRRSKENEGILIPHKEGWICPCGKYTQDWCHDFMVK